MTSVQPSAAATSVATGRSGSQLLVDQLLVHGVEHVFTVPGESFLGVLDALGRSSIAVTVCRQEGGAAMMADAVGKASGSPGVALVTRGPGAANAVAGVHVAAQDSTPMVLFVGLVERGVTGRDAFQEIDIEAVFGSLAKWAVRVDQADRIPETVRSAFEVAVSGRPGPVVIGLPSDMLDDETGVTTTPALRDNDPAPDAAAMATLADMLANAKRPIVVVGGSCWDETARTDLHAFAEHCQLPVATGYRRASLFDPLNPCYAGDLGLAANPKLAARVESADLVLVLGSRLGEITTQGYRLLQPPRGGRRLVHVHAGAGELGRVFQPDLAILAGPRRFAAALRNLPAPATAPWRKQTRQAHQEYLEWSETPTDQPGPVNLAKIMVWLRQNLPGDAILCNGAGNYASWIHRFYRFRGLATQIAPTSASMGYGVPSAVAMKRLRPGRTVVSINGDGDFLMNGQEFATAVQYGLPIVFMVFDNGMYGTIRMHQERRFPGRPVATDLRNPDFAAYGRAFGGWGAIVERTDDFGAAFLAAQVSNLPAVIHVRFDPDGITPTTTLAAIRRQALEG